MRRALLAAALAFSGCAATLPPEAFKSCGVSYAGDYDSRFGKHLLTQADIERAVMATLDGATFTTAPEFMDQTENCRRLMGYRVYTRQRYYEMTGRLVAGHTECWAKLIVVALPSALAPRNSALVHEMFHVLQNCEAPKPADPGQDDAHADWVRHNIYGAIDYEETQP